MRKRIVSRTITINTVTVTLYDKTSKQVTEEHKTVVGPLTPGQIERKLDREYKATDYKLISVDDIRIDNFLYYMEEEDFFQNAILMDKKDDVEEV